MKRLFENRDAANDAAEKLRVFAQPQRLMILSCLLLGERNVGEIAEITGIGQPALSQQLAELRRAELVTSRRESKQVWYELADETVTLCVQTMESMFGGSEPVGRPPRPPRREEPESLEGVANFARILGNEAPGSSR